MHRLFGQQGQDGSADIAASGSTPPSASSTESRSTESRSVEIGTASGASKAFISGEFVVGVFVVVSQEWFSNRYRFRYR